MWTASMQRFFDFCIDCDWPLPGLPDCPAGSAAWSVSRVADAGAGRDFLPFHTWQSPAGQQVMSAARCGEAYLLSFPGLARFAIDFAGRRIAAQALAGCADITLSHLLLDQVLPRAVCHQGRPVLHASAVLLNDGRAIAFTGPTGRGKSTLAAAFHRAGFPVLTDDCLLLQPQDEGLIAIPAYPSLRLWPDSLAALFGPAAGSTSLMAHYSDKKQLLLGSEGQLAVAQWPQLEALFLLADPATEALPSAAHEATKNGLPIHIRRSGGSAALVALLEAMFALDPVDRDAVQRSFNLVGEVASRVPLLKLRYPRAYTELARLVDTIATGKLQGGLKGGSWK